ncbi:NAD(+)/NADH kinase [bacterium]|nr:NAD(+)/NADH kinase [bacterium]
MTKLNKTIGIVAKPQSEKARELANEVLTWARQKNYKVVIEAEIADQLKLEDRPQVVSREEIVTIADPIVVLGGDGTLISVMRHPSKETPTVVGVNVGTLGFLTEITTAEMLPVLESVINGNARIRERTLLEVEVISAGKSEKTYAINDIVIGKEALARIFDVELYVDGEYATTFRGDGVIVATPIGSTAYSLAAHGSIVHPQVQGTLITPLCPHSLTHRPLVLPQQLPLVLKVPGEGADDKVYLTVDGQEGFDLPSGSEIRVQPSKFHVKVTKSPTKSYFEVLSTKLHWGTRPK